MISAYSVHVCVGGGREGGRERERERERELHEEMFVVKKHTD